MNILWLSHFVPYPPKAGMIIRSYNLLKQLARDHDVHLLACVQRKPLAAMFPSVEEGLAAASKELEKLCRSVTFVELPVEKSAGGKPGMALKSLFSARPYTVNWLISGEMEQNIKNVLQNERIDCVHMDTISFAHYLPLLGEIPRTMTHHNIESHMMFRRSEKENNPLKKLYFQQEARKLKKYEQEYCPRFQSNITCSRLDSERLLEFIPGIDVIDVGNGVDTGYHKPNRVSPRPKTLLFVGGLDWYPNTDAMLYFAREVWPRLTERCPEIVMNVVGKNPPQELLEVSKKYDNYVLHGFVDDIHQIFNESAVYVCPIRDGGGTKLKVLDALSMAIPIVADPIACEGIEVEDGKSVLFATTAEDYIEKIMALVNDTALQEQLSKSGRALAENKYEYDILGEKFRGIYQALGNSDASLS